jgi:hypothetical protein
MVDAQGPMRDDRDLVLLRQGSGNYTDYTIIITGNLLQVQLKSPMARKGIFDAFADPVGAPPAILLSL